jgi:hypothetical protein
VVCLSVIVKPRRNEEAQAHVGLSSHRKKIIVDSYMTEARNCEIGATVTPLPKCGNRGNKGKVITKLGTIIISLNVMEYTYI